MIELEAYKALWRDPASLPARPVSKEELRAMLHTKLRDVRARALQRVRAEVYTYLGIVVAIAAINLTSYGVTLKAVASTLAVLVLLGVVVAALLYKQHQLRAVTRNSTLRESLVALIVTLDSTSRLYMAAYMACVVIGTLAVEGFLLWRHGLTVLSLLSLAGAAVFVAWCYRSGRTYLRRMFGHYRTELTHCLRELEAA